MNIAQLLKKGIENFATVCAKYINDDNELVFTSGKYRGKRTNDICKTDP